MNNLSEILDNNYPKLFNKQNEFNFDIQYEITMACNNRCEYCYVLSELDNKEKINKKVFEETIEKINKFKEEYPDYKLSVHLKGGDPLFVIDETLEFISRIYDEKIIITIFSNLSFNPNGETIKKLYEFTKKYNICLICSVHESSNHKFVKRNLKLFNDIVNIHFVLDNKFVDFIYEYVNWILKNLKRKSHIYSLGELRDTNLYEIKNIDFNNEKLKFILKNADKNEGSVIIDNKNFTFQESFDLKLNEISKKYFTLCKINSFSIKYNGEISALCGYPGNFKDLKPQEKFCNNYICKCDTDSFKKLLREK
jgi:MoaA/NifB/PqqE/SkfB family radical SAM enzyme